jgi:hypothetical protein
MRNHNKYNPKLAVHPLGRHKAGVDIIHGKLDLKIEHGYIEAVEIARQQMANLINRYSVLFLNLITSKGQIERDHQYACNARCDEAGAFFHETLYAGELATKLKFFSAMVKNRQIGTLIICGYEFAAETTRHKKALVNWIKDLRSHSHVNVIIVAVQPLASFGLDGTLQQLANSLSPVGEYCTGDSFEKLPTEISRVEEEPVQEEPVQAEVVSVKDAEETETLDAEYERAEQKVIEAKSDDPVEAGPGPEDGKTEDPVQDETLKNKELSEVKV